MSVKSILEKIRTFLNEEETEVQLVDVKTTDGLILSFEALEVGKELFIVDESGRVPATDGEYILEDGTKIVAEAGLIKEIEMPEAPVEGPSEPEAEMPAEEMKTTLSVEDLMSKIEALEKDNADIRAILTQLAESFNKETFKEEVKMSMVEPEKVELEKVEKVEKPKRTYNKKENELNTILKNMYK